MKRKVKKGDLDEMQKRQLDYEKKIINKDLTDAFIHFFVKILGQYRGFIKDGKFDRDGFLDSQPVDIRGVRYSHTNFVFMIVG